MLAVQNIINDTDNAAIQVGLDDIQKEIDAGTFPYRDEFEDIHLNIEARLRELDWRGGQGGCIRRALAMTKWRQIFGCG